MHFEWDRTKAETNLKRHRVSFDEAVTAGSWPPRTARQIRNVGGSATSKGGINMTTRTLVRVAAVIAFLICLIGGLWILFHMGFKTNSDAVWTGLGLYFVGKAFFVGPMLLAAAEQLDRVHANA